MQDFIHHHHLLSKQAPSPCTSHASSLPWHPAPKRSKNLTLPSESTISTPPQKVRNAETRSALFFLLQPHNSYIRTLPHIYHKGGMIPSRLPADIMSPPPYTPPIP